MTDNHGNYSQNVTVNVVTPNSRGAGTVLMLVLFGWWLLPWWWSLLLTVWMVWVVIAGVTAFFDHGDLFSRTWYQPLPLWLFGIR